MTAPDARPVFPDQWHALEIPLDELTLAHTLPVGQTFLWHRQPLRRAGFVPEREGDVKQQVGVDSPVERERSPRVEVERIETEPQAFVKHEPIDTLPLVNPDASLDSNPSSGSITPSHSPTDEWSRAIPNPPRVIFLRQTPHAIHYASLPSSPRADRTYLLDLFNTHVTAPHGSLSRVYDAWARADPALFGKTKERNRVPRGVRVLRQDPWECLISFITSSANNVPRITSLMHRLSQHFSPALTRLPLPDHQPSPDPSIRPPSTAYHLFPRPGDLLRHVDEPSQSTTTPRLRLEQTLRELGFGYRARFIAEAVRTLVCAHGTEEERRLLGEEAPAVPAGELERDVRGVEAFLISLRADEAAWRAELLALQGVGRKVADCIGLMSLDRHHVVPIDTHLQQIAARHPRFPAKLKSKAPSTEAVYNAVQAFLCDLWTAHSPSDDDDDAQQTMALAGWCQSVMFAADLKGSTAVVDVKVEQTTVVEEEMGDAPEGKIVGKRNGRRVVKREVESTASVVSDMLDQTIVPVPPTSAPSTTKAGQKRKREATPDTLSARKATSRKTRVKVERTHISDMMSSSKRSSHVGSEARVKGEVDLRDQASRTLSRRAERYSVRCDKLEVDVHVSSDVFQQDRGPS